MSKHIFKSSGDLITFKAAYSRLVKQGSVDPSGYVKLGDLKDLMVPIGKTRPAQAWSFKGDWKKSVAPYFHA